MSKRSQYKWLIVVEGKSDFKTYTDLLKSNGVEADEFEVFSAKGKSSVLKTNNWSRIIHGKYDLFAIVNKDIARTGFCGIILVVDSDSDVDTSFDTYERNASLAYIYDASSVVIENREGYRVLDYIDGASKIPVLGINVPMGAEGCLETDLLKKYGFPVFGQPEYENLACTIKKATPKWGIEKLGDGHDWWFHSKRPKFDKFIYNAMNEGFRVCVQNPRLPAEPDVIKNIKAAMAYRP